MQEIALEKTVAKIRNVVVTKLKIWDCGHNFAMQHQLYMEILANKNFYRFFLYSVNFDQLSRRGFHIC